jgi:transcriptional regulator with XRE-family HTH domain
MPAATAGHKPTESLEAYLATTVRPALEKWDQPQGRLAKLCGVDPGELSRFLKGERRLKPFAAANLAQALGLNVAESILRCEIDRATEEHAAADEDAGNAAGKAAEKAAERRRGWQAALDVFQDALNHTLKSQAQPKKPPVAPVRDYISLEDFPNLVPGPWTVILGDRRERPVQGLGDVIGLSASSSDFMFIPQLGLPPETTVVQSDKSVLVATDRSLRELMKTNLLIIGSPAVSLAARKVLREVGATFLFNIGDDAYTREQNLYEKVAPPPDRVVQEKSLSRRDIRGERDELLATFRQNGFVDPVDCRSIRGRAIPQHKDYGMVALARNPWSEQHIACICAGVHGGGTAAAVQLLASPQRSFKERPWGGVFWVNMPELVPWEKRFDNLIPKWETHAYKPKKYLNSIAELIQRVDAPGKGGRPSGELKQLDLGKETLERTRDLATWLAQGPRATPAPSKTRGRSRCVE